MGAKGPNVPICHLGIGQQNGAKGAGGRGGKGLLLSPSLPFWTRLSVALPRGNYCPFCPKLGNDRIPIFGLIGRVGYGKNEKKGRLTRVAKTNLQPRLTLFPRERENFGCHWQQTADRGPCPNNQWLKVLNLRGNSFNSQKSVGFSRRERKFLKLVEIFAKIGGVEGREEGGGIIKNTMEEWGGGERDRQEFVFLSFGLCLFVLFISHWCPSSVPFFVLTFISIHRRRTFSVPLWSVFRVCGKTFSELENWILDLKIRAKPPPKPWSLVSKRTLSGAKNGSRQLAHGLLGP